MTKEIEQTRRCLYCSAEISPIKRIDAKYCSDTCRETCSASRIRKTVQRGPRKTISRKDYKSKRDRAKVKSKERYKKNPEKFLKKKDLVTYPKGKYAKARSLGFRSMFEVAINEQLKNSGISFEYETKKIPYVIKKRYVPDFILSNGIVIECKGYLDAQGRQTLSAVKKQHPSLNLRVVFMREDVSNIRWAEKLGIPWSVEKIPEGWLK